MAEANDDTFVKEWVFNELSQRLINRFSKGFNCYRYFNFPNSLKSPYNEMKYWRRRKQLLKLLNQPSANSSVFKKYKQRLKVNKKLMDGLDRWIKENS